MPKLTHSITLGACLIAVAPVAIAAPISLTADQFATQTAGLESVVETFEGFPAGAYSNPLVIANGSYSSVSNSPFESFPTVHRDEVLPELCAVVRNNCLGAGEITDTRTFRQLPSGSAFWSTDLHFLAPEDILEITVVGGGGTTLFSQSGPTFFGTHDSFGLFSVTFVNQGRAEGTSTAFGNYSFDNVTTARQLSEPSSMALFGLVLLGIAASRRRS